MLKLQAQAFMNSLCTSGKASALNQGVMELGQVLCTPQSPQCDRCPVQDFCQAYKNNEQGLFPVPKIRKKIIPFDLWLVVTRDKNCCLKMTLRDHKQKFLKGLEGLPTFYDRESLLSTFPQAKEIGHFFHAITNHKIKVRVYLNDEPGMPNETYYAEDLFSRHLVSNLDQKALVLYQKKKEADQQRSASLYIIRAKRGEEGVKLDSRLPNVTP